MNQGIPRQQLKEQFLIQMEDALRTGARILVKTTCPKCSDSQTDILSPSQIKNGTVFRACEKCNIWEDCPAEIQPIPEN